jgi:chromosome segregation and condensation protein ScpB
MNPLARQVEALLFLSPDPVALVELADALQCGDAPVAEALSDLAGAIDGRRVDVR